MLPHYIFLPDGSYIMTISNQQDREATLIHSGNTNQRVVIDGAFFDALAEQVNSNSKASSEQLFILEKQHAWLEGLSQASLEPKSLEQLIIGDELGLLFVEVTDQCNEKCIHCYASSSPSCSNFLTIEEIKSILTQAREFGTPSVQFTGGDPLIHHHLIDAVAFAHALKFQEIEVYTNGLLLSDALIEQLLPFHPKLAFSLYSPDAVVHDSITQVPGSFEKTVSAIHRAQDMALNVRIGMAVMEQNAGHEQSMLDYVKNEYCLEPSSVRFDPVHQTGRGSQLHTQHISLMPSQNSHMPDVKHHQVIQKDKPAVSQDFMAAQNTLRRGKLAVCANGDVSPCIFNREHAIGNIRSQSLSDILNENINCDANLRPSIDRWNHCQHNLSCSDCQMIAYTLGDS